MRSGKSIIAASVLLFFCTLLYSQPNGSSINFRIEQHNFGRINESDGKVQHDFVFTNKGDGPLIVTNVRPAGGIVVLRRTTSPVMPGDSGTITLEFDPHNMPGLFNRSITVNATGNPSSMILRLLGEVIPREKTPAELYPQEIGAMRLRSNHISLGRVTPGSIKADSLEVINLSDETLDIAFSGIPGHVSVRAAPDKLKPGAKGVIIASWDAGKVVDWGTTTENFRVLLNGLSHGRNIIYLSANIQEDFSGMGEEEKKNAAGITFDNRVFDFGKLKHGATIEHDFIFSNTGKSNLILRSVRSGCGCTAIEPQQTVIKPGESSSIKSVFNSRGFMGRQNKGITVITNDPSNPNIVLRITGEVVAD